MFFTIQISPRSFILLPLEKSIAKIDFSKSAEEIKNLIRGLDPIMGAYVMYDGKKITYYIWI